MRRSLLRIGSLICAGTIYVFRKNEMYDDILKQYRELLEERSRLFSKIDEIEDQLDVMLEDDGFNDALKELTVSWEHAEAEKPSDYTYHYQ
jgi:hypothetical protein